MRPGVHLLALLCATLLRLSTGAATAAPLMAYHDSWRERAVQVPAETTLAQTPGYVGLVALAFVRPDLRYRGSLDLSGVGLDYRFDGRMLRRAVALLKQRHPATRVLLSVGGAAYRDWDGLDPAAVGWLVRDLGVDGVDVDYETADPGCGVGPDGHIACRKDAALQSYVTRLRRALPRPYVLSVAAVSVGAYGEGAFRTAGPMGGPYVGAMLGLFRSRAASAIDLVSIDAYDAGPQFDPLRAFAAYRQVWKGDLLLGLEVRLPGGEGPVYSAAEAFGLAQAMRRASHGGIMVYPMLERPAGFAVSPEHPDGTMLLQSACRGLKLSGC